MVGRYLAGALQTFARPAASQTLHLGQDTRLRSKGTSGMGCHSLTGMQYKQSAMLPELQDRLASLATDSAFCFSSHRSAEQANSAHASQPCLDDERASIERTRLPHKEMVQNKLNEILSIGTNADDEGPRDPLEEVPVEHNQAVAFFGRAVYEVTFPTG